MVRPSAKGATMASATPRWDMDDGMRRGASAERLFEKHKAILGPELPEGLGAQLSTDLDFLETVRDGTVLGRQRTATARKRAVAIKGHRLIGLFRNAAKRSPNGTDELRSALRVGKRVDKDDVPAILDVLSEVATHADALRACGAPASAIASAATLATELQASSSTQQDAKQGRHGTTEERVDALLRVEAAIEAIHIAGTFAFWEDPAIFNRFMRLVASTGPTDADLEEDDDDDDDDLDA